MLLFRSLLCSDDCDYLECSLEKYWRTRSLAWPPLPPNLKVCIIVVKFTLSFFVRRCSFLVPETRLSPLFIVYPVNFYV